MKILVDALKQFHTFCNRSQDSRLECHSQDFLLAAKSNDADDADGIKFVNGNFRNGEGSVGSVVTGEIVGLSCACGILRCPID